jgi:ADP-ribosylarginine hydrolase
MEQKYIATFVLHAIGDMIGFKNGEWEFNYQKKMKDITLNTTNEMLYDFISLGGINGIDFTEWHVSDDTMMHIATADIVYEYSDEPKKISSKVKYGYVGVLSDITNKKTTRLIGNTTKNYIIKMLKDEDGSKLPYDPSSGGNGSAMRTACIGLAYFGKNKLDDLIEVSIETSRVTHNSPIGWLGGLTTALFTAYAVEGINITEWPFKLIELLKSDKILKYIRKEYEEDEINDLEIYLDNWMKYVDNRFDEKIPIKSRAHGNLIFRLKFHFENFTVDSRSRIVGDSGYSATIMAYDALLDCNGNWEPLIIYSAIHPGDGDTVGSIASAWYGVVYGMDKVPINNYKTLEYKEYLIELGKRFYNKFYLNKKTEKISSLSRTLYKKYKK